MFSVTRYAHLPRIQATRPDSYIDGNLREAGDVPPAPYWRIKMLLAPLLLAMSAADVSPLPVQSITAFKDGHALVIREGERAVKGGEIKLDGLPNPLLGSFWPYTPDEGLRVVSATASRWEEDSERDNNIEVEIRAW